MTMQDKNGNPMMKDIILGVPVEMGKTEWGNLTGWRKPSTRTFHNRMEMAVQNHKEE